jgi:hypothetical protein
MKMESTAHWLFAVGSESLELTVRLTHLWRLNSIDGRQPF